MTKKRTTLKAARAALRLLVRGAPEELQEGAAGAVLEVLERGFAGQIPPWLVTLRESYDRDGWSPTPQPGTRRTSSGGGRADHE